MGMIVWGNVSEELEGRGVGFAPGDGETLLALEVRKRLDHELAKVAGDTNVARGKSPRDQELEQLGEDLIDARDGAEFGLRAEDFREELLRVFESALGVKICVMATEFGMSALARKTAATACGITIGAAINWIVRRHGESPG